MSDQTNTLDSALVELRELRKDVETIKKELSANHEIQAEMKELYKSIRGFMKVMSWFERIAIFMTKIAAGGAVIWGVFKFASKELPK